MKNALTKRLTKTQQALLLEAAKSANGVVVVTYSYRGLNGGKTGFGIRRKNAAIQLQEMGVLELIDTDDYRAGSGSAVYALPCRPVRNASVA